MSDSLDPARVTLALPAADPVVELRVDDVPIVTVVIPDPLVAVDVRLHAS